MALSPFGARLAVAVVMCVSGGVAANILSLQEPAFRSPEVREKGWLASPASDGERLRRLSLEATSETSSRRPIHINASDTRHVQTMRLGSFAPSSSHLSKSTMPSASIADARRATIAAVQAELGRRGYEPGRPDGTLTLVTRAAVFAYEYDQGLPLTADPSPEILAHLRYGSSAPGMAIGLDPEGGPKPGPGHAEAVIRSVQQFLHALGYRTAPPDGQANEDSVRAIREFEMDAGLVPTGRISAPLVTRLVNQVNARSRK